MIEQTLPDAPAFSARSVVIRASGTLLACERLALMGLMYLLTALILVNVVTRYTGFPIYWIDESAVYSRGLADLHRRLRDDAAAARFRGHHADRTPLGADAESPRSSRPAWSWCSAWR